MDPWDSLASIAYLASARSVQKPMKEHDVAETSFSVLCLACLQSGVDLSAAGVLLMFKKFETWGHFGFWGFAVELPVL